MDQYRFTASGEPEQITISVLVMLVPTPSPTQPFPLYVTVNVALVLSEDKSTLAVTCEPNAFVFDAAEALGEGDGAAGAEPDGTMAHFTPAPRAVWYERVVLVLYAQIKSVSAPLTTLRAFSWFPLAATLRVNVMVVFPPL